MLLVINSTSTNQEKVVLEILAARRVTVETIVNHIHQQFKEQLLGRDAIIHQARHEIQQGFQRIPHAAFGLAMAAGIDMQPEGVFLVCVAMAMTRPGRQIEGWSTPRLLPEEVSREISKGGNVETLLENYRRQWKPVDVFSRIDLDELIDRHASYSEAVAMAIDGLFQVKA